MTLARCGCEAQKRKGFDIQHTVVWKKCWLSKAEASYGAQVWPVAGIYEIQMGAGLKPPVVTFYIGNELRGNV